METSTVRQRLRDTIERAKRRAADRRSANDRATRAFDTLLSTTIVPLTRQLASILKAEGYAFTVFTPSGAARFASDKNAEDFIEITLDTAGGAPRVVGRVSRSRGRRVVDAEHVIASGDPEMITEEELLAFLLKELEAFVER